VVVLAALSGVFLYAGQAEADEPHPAEVSPVHLRAKLARQQMLEEIDRESGW
jgi:hypothetical protein